MIKHSLVTKHFDVVLSGLRYRTRLNEQNVFFFFFFAIFDQMFDVVEILSDTIKKAVQEKKRFGHQTIFDRVLSPNIFHFGRALDTSVRHNIPHSVAFGTAKMCSVIVCQTIDII